MQWRHPTLVSVAALLIFSLGVQLFAQNAVDEATEPPAPESPLADEPQTVDEYFDSAILVLQLARPELARHYLQQLLAQNPDDETLLALRDKYGMASFMSLTQVEELEGPANELLKRVTAAARTKTSNPEYVQKLIDGVLASGRTREQAVLELQQLGPLAVGPLLSRLRQVSPSDQGRIIFTLTQLGEPIAPALIGALRSNNAGIRSAAAKGLGWVGTEEDALWLWHPALSESESPAVRDAARTALAQLLVGDESRVDQVSSYGAVRRMLATARRHLSENYRWGERLNPEGTVSVWSWEDTGAGKLVEYKVQPRLASVFLAERLAREAVAIAPENDEGPIVLLASLLTYDMEQAGWASSLPKGPGTAHDVAVSAGPKVCEQVLALALDNSMVAAAVGSIEALALNGSPALLRTGLGQQSPIQRALDATSERIQFAAAVAILKWGPQQPFAKSQRVVEVLARAMNAEPQPNSVVVDPNEQRAADTAGLFREIGYNAVITTTGQQGFLAAATRGDMELAVLDLNTVRWDLTQTVANMRADSRTAGIPILVYGPRELRGRVNHLVHNYPKVIYIESGTETSDVLRQLTPVLKSFSPPPLTQQQRADQVKSAAYWLRRIAEGGLADLFDLSVAMDALSAGADQPSVAQDAIVTLSAIPTAPVQRRLLALATAPGEPMDVRRIAALKLAEHVRRFGRLLNEAEIDQLVAAADAESDELLRTALSTVIGVLRPTQKAVRAELLQFPQPTAPPQPKS